MLSSGRRSTPRYAGPNPWRVKRIKQRNRFNSTNNLRQANDLRARNIWSQPSYPAPVGRPVADGKQRTDERHADAMRKKFHCERSE